MPAYSACFQSGQCPRTLFLQAEDGTKVEYRVWNPFRSKIAAAVVGGIENLWIKPGDKVLYLGAASGTSVSHVSDLVGQVRFALARGRLFRCVTRALAHGSTCMYVRAFGHTCTFRMHVCAYIRMRMYTLRPETHMLAHVMLLLAYVICCWLLYVFWRSRRVRCFSLRLAWFTLLNSLTDQVRASPLVMIARPCCCCTHAFTHHHARQTENVHALESLACRKCATPASSPATLQLQAGCGARVA